MVAGMGMGSSQYSVVPRLGWLCGQRWAVQPLLSLCSVRPIPSHEPPAITLFMQSAGGGVAPGDISIISSHGSADFCWTAGSTPHPSVCPHVRGDTALDAGLPSGLYTADGSGGEWKC